ncbi:MAG: hypothetical protein QXW79_01710 [Thermoplasmata archaeon]
MSQFAKSVLFRDEDKGICTTYGDAELKFVRNVTKKINLTERVKLSFVLVGSNVIVKTGRSFGELFNKYDGNLNLTEIFNNELSSHIINMIDVAIIIVSNVTEKNNELEDIGINMMLKARHLKAIILVIVGKEWPYSDNTNFFIPYMLSNACILFYDTKRVYLMWSNEYFKKMWNINSQIGSDVNTNAEFFDSHLMRTFNIALEQAIDISFYNLDLLNRMD